MRRIPVSICFLILGAVSKAQTDVSEKIVAALDSFSFFRPQEKTYIQTDRNSYIAGETIWFNTYAILNEKPTILSKVIYVDLLDRSGKVVEKRMLQLKSGIADGSIDIKQELRSGYYFLRCYTLWMLNFPSFIAEKQLLILNSNPGEKESPKTLPAALNIEFFPEGGNMIAGIKGMVAFKGLNEKGLPAEINGELINSKNEKLLTFKSFHDGMGSFELTPVLNESYRAIIYLPGGGQKTVSLPAVKDEGINLSVDNSNPGKTFVKVERGEKNKEKYNNLLVVAQLNYQVAYMGKLNIDENLDAVAINKKNLPPGIMQITVITEDGQPLAERLVFVANHSIHNDLLQVPLRGLEKRKKNLIELNVPEYSNLKAAISITNIDETVGKYFPTILSSLLLSADIKGNIHDPGFYFKDKDPVTLQYLDLVMMINGWRRFRLEEIMANKLPPIRYPFETSLSVTGKVLESNGKTALAAGKINLIIHGVDSTHIISEAKTNTNSSFVVNDIGFSKEATIYYQGTNSIKPGAIVAVKIDSNYFDTLSRSALQTTVTALPGSPDPYIQQRLAEKQKIDSFSGKTLSEVVVKSRKLSETDSLNQLYASDIFYNSDQTLTLNEKINYYDIWQFLRMRVSGLAINQTDTGMQVNFTRYSGLDLFSENTTNSAVVFFLNEVPVDVNIIDMLNPSDVAMVKIFKGVTGIALGADRGAIALYTNKGRSTRDWRQKGFDLFKKSGYSVSREFYAMDHSKLNPEDSLSDIRPTLYWNPAIKVKDGRATIEFFNDDVARKFRVIIEGIDENGKLLHLDRAIE
jgi:hypothetical protein